MGYVDGQTSQISSEIGLLTPRLKCFAAALTGSEAKSQALLKATLGHLRARGAKERGHAPLALWAFAQMYKIWSAQMKGDASRRPQPADPRLYQPRSRLNDGGASARFAMQIAQLGPQQRGALHLIYGERLSYDEVAEIFDVPVSMIIARLAKCYGALAPRGGPERPRAPDEAVIAPPAGESRQRERAA